MNIALQLLEIIGLKRKPSEIAYDQTAAFLVFAVSIATAYFQLRSNKEFPSSAMSFALAQAIVQGTVFWFLLKIRNRENRFVQTMTALFGTTAILQFVALILMQVPAMAILGIFLTGWSIYIMVLILSEAIDVNILQSLLITIAYHFLIGLVLIMLFPEFLEQVRVAVEASAKA